MYFAVDLPPWLQLERLKTYLGRDPHSPTQTIEGDRFRFAMEHEECLAVVSAELLLEEARCTVDTVDGEPKGGWKAPARDRLHRLLGLHVDPRPFEDALAGTGHERLVNGRLGLTIPQTHDLLDGLIWVIVGQQVSLAVAFALRQRIAETFGRRVTPEFALWPTLETIAALDYADLGRIGFSRRKAEYLVDLARAVVDGALDLALLQKAPPDEVESTLLSIRGFGPWSVHYLMMRAFGFPDCVPVGDVALAKSLAEYFALDERPAKGGVLELMSVFAPHRSLATFHLWSRLADVG
ncbi:MAG: DNA-3-methyladenine glycosylase [Thermoanaerobaculia bacterium]|nr:DNA-3-methyladenine glycosylase [Thermoanaerobaculia bacterium]